MAVEYRSVDTSTLAGLRQAERLHNAGWCTGHVGLFRVMFYRIRPAGTFPKQYRANPKGKP